MSKHQGGCHCGAVRYQVELELGPVIACNCSICTKNGWLLAFAPASAFTLEQGADSLTEYLFNRHVIRHQFCKVCGIESFARGTAPDGNETVAINVRCLDGVDVEGLEINRFDGASM